MDLIELEVTEKYLLGISMGFQPRVQKWSPILIKFSAFVELSILNLFIKKIFQNAYVLMEITGKYYKHRRLKIFKKHIFAKSQQIVFDSFHHWNKIKNEI